MWPSLYIEASPELLGGKDHTYRVTDTVVLCLFSTLCCDYIYLLDPSHCLD